MAISIRNPEAERLAREVAARSGESITKAIIHSLEERLQRLSDLQRTPARAQELRAIARRCKALPDLDQRPADAILGYDEHGVC